MNLCNSGAAAASRSSSTVIFVNTAVSSKKAVLWGFDREICILVSHIPSVAYKPARLVSQSWQTLEARGTVEHLQPELQNTVEDIHVEIKVALRNL